MKQKAVVLGGGVAGLAAGWLLARGGNYAVTVLERAPVIGGACGTFRHGDYLLDYGPHKCYSTLPGVLDELKSLMGDELLEHEKKNAIFLFNSLLKYPVGMRDLISRMGFKDLVECGTSAAAAVVSQLLGRHNTDSYENYIVGKFGRKIYQLVFEPLADKVWGDPSTLSADIARTRLPSTGVFDVAMRALGLKKESGLTDAKHFYYPKQGFGRIPQRMADEIVKSGGVVLTQAAPTRVRHTDHKITDVDFEVNGGIETISCDLLISSLPLNQLLVLLGGDEEPDVKDTLATARQLQYRTAFLVYVFLRKESVTTNHWTFFPERDIIFGRVFEQKLLSAEMAPQSSTVVCCDFTDYDGGALSLQTDGELAARCIVDLEKVAIIDRSWVDHSFVVRLPHFYPRYDLLYKTTTAAVYNSLKRFDRLLSTGRIGFYNYNNSDHCVDMAKFITDNVEAGKPTSQIWAELETRVADYRIVD